MNAFTKFPLLPDAPAPISRSEARERHAQGHERFTTNIEIELSGDPRCGTSFRCEVEFYQSAEAIEETREEPGEPAQYDIASVRPYVLKTRDGRSTTEREYLDAPDWLQDMLMACVDENTLAEAAL